MEVFWADLRLTDLERLEFLLETDATAAFAVAIADWGSADWARWIADLSADGDADEVARLALAGASDEERRKYVTNCIGSKQKLVRADRDIRLEAHAGPGATEGNGPWQEGAIKENGAGHGVRTRDIQLGKLIAPGCNSAESNELQTGENPVTPPVTPESQVDPKKALIEALRKVDRETLLQVLAEVLTDAKNPSRPG